MKATIATRGCLAVTAAAVMLTGCSPVSPVDGDVSVAERAIGETVAGSPVAPATVREHTRDTRRIVGKQSGWYHHHEGQQNDEDSPRRCRRRTNQ